MQIVNIIHSIGGASPELLHLRMDKVQRLGCVGSVDVYAETPCLTGAVPDAGVNH